ncbi:MAG: hypothetical protein KJZ80_18735 [Hyphomicrobiaceae bacterium]|nr:hypothetical protein [Hyphomicrobiaceae bacterium]
MTDQGTQVAVQGSLRDVLRALESEEDDLMPLGGILSGGLQMARSTQTAPLHRVESRSPAVVLGAEEPEPALRWRNLIDLRATRTTALAFGMAAPVTIMLFAGTLMVAPSPKSEWARSALNEVWFEDASSPGSRAPAPTAGASSPERGVQAFAMLGRRVLAAGIVSPLHSPPAVYSLSARDTVEVWPGETVALPFEVAGADSLPAGARLIVRGLPEFAALSSAEPQADGSWALPVERAPGAKLTAYALPTLDGHELIAELRSGGGELLARASTRLRPQPETRLEPAVATTPAAGSSAPGGPVHAEPPARAGPPRVLRGTTDSLHVGSPALAMPIPHARPSTDAAGPKAVPVAPALTRTLAAKRPPPLVKPAAREQVPVEKAPEVLEPWSRSALGAYY